MTRARTLADMISDGVIGTTELADDAITPVKLDETGNYTIAQLDVNGTLTSDGLTVGDNSTSEIPIYFNSSSTDFSIGANGNNFILAQTTGDLDSNQLLTVTSTGSVGIGTSSPSTSLHVSTSAENVATFASTDTAARIVITDGTDTGYVNVSSGKVSLGQTLGLNASNLNIDSSGRVGIGTSSPQLDFVVSNNGAQGFEINSSGVISGGIDVLSYNRSTSAYAPIYNNASYHMWATSTTERMRIDSSGNLLIGSTDQVQNGDISLTRVSTDANISLLSRSTTDSHSCSIQMQKTPATSGNYTATSSGDQLGAIVFRGVNTSAVSKEGASISVSQTGTSASTVPAAMIFDTNGSEAMRIDSSGNLLVGKTSSGSSVRGSELRDGVSGFVATFKSDADGINIDRSTDGDLINLRKNGSPVGTIGSNVSGSLYINGTGNGYTEFRSDETTICALYSGGFYPTPDNSRDLGQISYRWDDIYATNGTIQTSDRNEKQDIEVLSDAEQRVAVAAKGLLRKFRWIDAVEEKGDEARTHFGIIAQDLQAAFAAEGLDAGDYAMFTSSTWTDEDTGEERSRMGVRYSELLAFIIAAI